MDLYVLIDGATFEKQDQNILISLITAGERATSLMITEKVTGRHLVLENSRRMQAVQL